MFYRRNFGQSMSIHILNIDPEYKKQVKGTFSQSVIGRHC